ncbi:hypothetical protein SBADM41S_01442 [Streptomyces badius]
MGGAPPRPPRTEEKNHWASDSPKARRPHRQCSTSVCATPSAAASGSPATETSSGPSSGHCAAPRCRWRIRPARAHPKVSYANAAPTGTGSEAEFLEIALTEARDPEVLRELLDASMPVGLDIVDAVEARTSGLAERLTASVWELRLDGVEPEDVRTAVAAFNDAETVEVQRKAKNGIRTFDARAAVADLRVVDAPVDRPGERPCAILRLVVRHVTPAVRPDDVLSGLRAVADLAPPVPAAVTRLAQGLFDEESGRRDRPSRARPRGRPDRTSRGRRGSQCATAPEGAGSA